MSADDAFLAAFEALPVGAFRARYGGRVWEAARTLHANGRSQKLVAHAPGGAGYVSLNLYFLENGRALLRPCEMPDRDVRDFVTGAVVTGPAA